MTGMPTRVTSAFDGLSDNALALVQDAYADNTKRAYRAAWGRFREWCDGRGLVALPSHPEQVANFLADESARSKPSTVALRLAAIAKAHHVAGESLDTRHPAITAVMKGIRRTKGVRPSQKDALLLDDLRRMVRSMGGAPIDVRDRAMLLLGFAGAMRRSEIVALDRSDIRLHENGLIITIRRSKTDTEGEGVELGVHKGRTPDVCPVAAVLAWVAELDAADSDPALFRRVGKGGRILGRLSDRSVARIVQARAEGAGIEGDFGGHSLRAGLCTEAVERGFDLSSVVRQSRHKSLAVAAEYIRPREIWVNNVTSLF